MIGSPKNVEAILYLVGSPTLRGNYGMRPKHYANWESDQGYMLYHADQCHGVTEVTESLESWN